MRLLLYCEQRKNGMRRTSDGGGNAAKREKSLIDAARATDRSPSHKHFCGLPLENGQFSGIYCLFPSSPFGNDFRSFATTRTASCDILSKYTTSR
jgi:hypothetical protein